MKRWYKKQKTVESFVEINIDFPGKMKKYVENPVNIMANIHKRTKISFYINVKMTKDFIENRGIQG